MSRKKASVAESAPAEKPIESLVGRLPPPIWRAIGSVNRDEQHPGAIKTIGDFVCWATWNSLSGRCPGVGGLAIFKTRELFRELGIELQLCRQDVKVVEYYFRRLVARSAVERDLRKWVFRANSFSPEEFAAILKELFFAECRILQPEEPQLVFVIPNKGHEPGIRAICEKLFETLPVEEAGDVLRSRGIL
jgi:hypothetical protein